MSDKISILPDDTILSIEMNGHFYKRLQGLLASMTEGYDMEDVMKIYKAATEDKITSPIEYHIQTMLYLCKAVEDVCTNQNLWEEVDIKDVLIEGDSKSIS